MEPERWPRRGQGKNFTQGDGPTGAGVESVSRGMALAAPAILGAALMSLVSVVNYARTGFKDRGSNL